MKHEARAFGLLLNYPLQLGTFLGELNKLRGILAVLSFPMSKGKWTGIVADYDDWTGKWIEPRSNIPWLKKIIWVIGVLRSYIQSQRTWLWRWLPHSLSKRQSRTTVLLRTPITQMMFFNQGTMINQTDVLLLCSICFVSMHESWSPIRRLMKTRRVFDTWSTTHLDTWRI